MNNWDAIRAHYRRAEKTILDERRDEWAIDAYAWDNGMIRMTPIEVALWADIRGSNAVFYPQYPVLGFFVDFANPVVKVAIECDGARYHTDPRKDAERDSQLRDIGWSVYRITGRDCLTDSDEETGDPGYAGRFVAEICERHGLSRCRQGHERWTRVSGLELTQGWI